MVTHLLWVWVWMWWGCGSGFRAAGRVVGAAGQSVLGPGGIGRTCGRSTPGCVCLTQGVWCCCGCAAQRTLTGVRRRGRSECGARGDIKVSGDMCGDGHVLVVGRAVWPSEQARVGAWGS
jgi:hypothetical protein